MASSSLVALLVAAASATASPSSAGSQARRVAVLDFSARWAASCARAQSGADEERCDMLRLLADQSRAGALTVLRPPTYVVMTRENSAQILKDMGGVCADGECEVETARLLGASLVVSGEVSFMEGTWLVSLKVHDVGSAALLGTGSTEGRSKLEAFRNVRNETERMLKAAAVDGSARVAAAPPPPAPKKPDPEGTLRLVVADDDALVLLDGKEVGRGPLKQDRKLLEGTHRLVVMKEGHATFEDAYKIDAGVTVTASPRLVAIPRTVGAAPPPPALEPWRQDRFYVEIVPGVPAMQAISNSDLGGFAVFKGGIALTLRTGMRWNPNWAVEAAVQANEVAGNGDRDMHVKDTAGVVGAAWTPTATSPFALAFGIGGASVKTDTSASGPVAYGEARYDYPVGSFSFGLRVGVRAAAVSSELRSRYGGSPTGQAVDVRRDGIVLTFPLAAAVRFRF